VCDTRCNPDAGACPEHPIIELHHRALGVVKHLSHRGQRLIEIDEELLMLELPRGDRVDQRLGCIDAIPRGQVSRHIKPCSPDQIGVDQLRDVNVPLFLHPRRQRRAVGFNVR